MKRLFLPIIALAAMFSFTHSLPAATLTAVSATATIASDSAMTVFKINNGPDNVFIADFWFRTDTTMSGNGGEVNLGGLGPVTETLVVPNQVRYTAANSQLSAVETWTLSGLSPLTQTASIESVLTLTNISNAAVPLTLFYAADLDIAFDPVNPNDQTTAISINEVSVFDPVTLNRIDSTVSPNPDAYQVYEGQFEVLLDFNADLDGATTLTNTPAFGTTVTDVPGTTDAGFAFSWTTELAPGQSFSASARHVATVVPEPTSFALLAVVGTCIASRCRRRRHS